MIIYIDILKITGDIKVEDILVDIVVVIYVFTMFLLLKI